MVKVEPPEGDQLRRRPPFAGDRVDPDGSLSFAYYQANKRGVMLDYRRPAAAAVLAGLGANCDVVVLTPTAREPVAGFDAATGELAWAGPATVICSITPFGLTGPYRTWRATHLTSHAMSGLMYVQGLPEGPPTVVPGQQLYNFVGAHAAIAVLTALRARPQAGGQLIDMSAHEVMTSSCFDIYSYTNGARIGHRRPPAAQYSGGGTWQCRDGVVEFVASTDKHWFALMELLGHPAELADPSWGHPGKRHPYEDKIMEVMRPLVAAMSREELRRAGPAARPALHRGQHGRQLRRRPAAAQPRLLRPQAAGRAGRVRPARRAPSAAPSGSLSSTAGPPRGWARATRPRSPASGRNPRRPRPCPGR